MLQGKIDFCFQCKKKNAYCNHKWDVVSDNRRSNLNNKICTEEPDLQYQLFPLIYVSVLISLNHCVNPSVRALKAFE